MLMWQFRAFFRKEPPATLPLPPLPCPPPSSGHPHSDPQNGPEGGPFDITISI